MPAASTGPDAALTSAERCEVIVLGLGAIGSAVALRLAQRGIAVTGIDRFSPPHPHGSTHGDTRITRLAIGEGAQYVPLVRRSHVLWRALERQTGTRLLHQTGGLILGQRDNGFLRQTRAAAVEYGIGHENLGTDAVRQRFPMFRVPPGTEAYFEPEAGYVCPEAAVRAQLTLATQSGARLITGARADSWQASTSGVTVATERETVDAEHLVVCAGAWMASLVPDLAPHLAVYEQLLHWLPIREGYAALRDMPVFVWDFGEALPEFGHGSGFYGFPAVDGPAGGVKLATETYESTTAPDDRRALGDEAAQRLYDRCVAGRLHGLGARPLRTVACLYTNARGSRFIIDRHPRHANVTIVSACSGHGFKHSAAIGEAVAHWVADGTRPAPLAPFSLAGFA